MKAYPTTRMVEQPFWACLDAEHAHATEPLANACIRATEAEAVEFYDVDLSYLEEETEVVPVKRATKKTKRGKRGV